MDTTTPPIAYRERDIVNLQNGGSVPAFFGANATIADPGKADPVWGFDPEGPEIAAEITRLGLPSAVSPRRGGVYGSSNLWAFHRIECRVDMHYARIPGTGTTQKFVNWIRAYIYHLARIDAVSRYSWAPHPMKEYSSLPSEPMTYGDAAATFKYQGATYTGPVRMTQISSYFTAPILRSYDLRVMLAPEFETYWGSTGFSYPLTDLSGAKTAMQTYSAGNDGSPSGDVIVDSDPGDDDGSTEDSTHIYQVLLPFPYATT